MVKVDTKESTAEGLLAPLSSDHVKGRDLIVYPPSSPVDFGAILSNEPGRSAKMNDTGRVALWGSCSHDYDVIGSPGSDLHAHIHKRDFWIAEWLRRLVVMLGVALLLLVAEYPLGLLGKVIRVAWKVLIGAAKWLGLIA